MRQEGYGTGAFPADALQHGVIVARANAEIARDHLALGLLWQDAGEEATAFFAAEALGPQRQ